MIAAAITLTKESKTSANLLSEFMTFNEEKLYTISSGAGNIEVSNSNEYAIYGERSMKIRYLTNAPATFNAGSSTNSIVKRTGRYFLAWEISKSDSSADVNFTVEMFVNGTLTAERTFIANAYSTSGFTEGQINTFYQSFNLNANDEVSFTWTAQCDTTDTIIYVDGFKLEFDDKGLQLPTFYTEPSYKTLKWQTRTDLTNEPTITSATPTDFAFTGDTIESNVSNTLLTVTGFSVPSKVNTVITRDYCFTAVVPTGGSKTIQIDFVVNATIVRSRLYAFVKSAGSEEIVSGSWTIPVNQTFLENQGKIILTTNADTVIKKRISSHVEYSNS